MKTSEVLKSVQETFFQKMEAKTGWGKNEVKALYQETLIEVLGAITDKVTGDEE